MQIRYTKLQILQILYSLITHYQRTYCWPTRKKILELLEKRYKTIISLSALDQHLASLNAGRYIRSYRRTGRSADGTIYNLPSNRSVTWKTITIIRLLGARVPGWLIAWLKSGVLPGGRRKINPKREQPEITQGERRCGASRPQGIASVLEKTLGKICPAPAES